MGKYDVDKMTINPQEILIIAIIQICKINY